ncbi:MAG: HTH domain-containing protein [Erysipelotrichaceae bacterium]
MALSEKEMKILESIDDNDFVDDVDTVNMKFTYSKDFYVVMAKLLNNGKTAVEAYEALGFDTSIVGKNRAYMAAKRALKNAKKENYGISPGDYDGSIEREKMGELSPEEELAYYKARSLYLEKVIEFQKKIPQILARNGISLQEKN